MKPTALHIERWLSNVEARLVPPPLRVLQVKVYAARDKEKALAEVAARYPDGSARASACAAAKSSLQLMSSTVRPANVDEVIE